MNNSSHPSSVLKQKVTDIIRDSAAKAEKDGLIRPKGPGTRFGKSVTWEYELVTAEERGL